MNTKTDWQELGKLSGKPSGRPSKVEMVIGMDLGEFYAGGGDGGGLNFVARALKEWLARNGVEVCLSTAKRVVRRLIKDGKLVMERAEINGKASVIKPAEKAL